MSNLRPIEIRTKTGNNKSVANTFYTLKNVFNYDGEESFIKFDLPLYYTAGGSMNYYSEDPEMLFTNISNPVIRFFFTGNTHSLSGKTQIRHNVYKLDYNLYKNYNPDFTKTLGDLENLSENKTETESIFDDNGALVSRQTKITETTSNKQVDNFRQLNTTPLSAITYALENPVYTDSVDASGVTNVYDYELPQFRKSNTITYEDVKSTNNEFPNEDEFLPYAREVFTDKSQYFIETYFRFFEETDPKDSDNTLFTKTLDNIRISLDHGYKYKNINLDDSGNEIETHDYILSSGATSAGTVYEALDALIQPECEFYNTDSKQHVITSETFQNIVVQGNFFTYMTLPNQPIFEPPILDGEFVGFSPKVYYSNVDDGDSSVVQVTYDLNDVSFSGSKFTYRIDKDLNDFNVQEAIFTVRPNQNFRYRVGNVKSITNLFEVEQSIVTYTDSFTGKSISVVDPSYVEGINSSPFLTGTTEPFFPPSLSGAAGNYMLSGNVSGSIVTGATLELQKVGSNMSETIVTDLVGDFVFSDLESGNYTLTTTYRGYKEHVQEFFLSEDTTKNYVLQLLWSNKYDTWADKANDIIGINGGQGG